MRHRWLPKERPEHFEINSDCWLSRGLVFAGLGGLGCHHSSRFADSSWYGNHGTLTNMDPTTDWVWVPELGRWVLDFGGASDYVSVGDSPALQLGTGSMAFSAWFKEPTGAGWRDIASKWSDGFAVQISAGGTPMIGSPTEGGLWVNFAGLLTIGHNVRVDDGARHHMAITRSGNIHTLYQDGVSVASGTGTVANINALGNALVFGDLTTGGQQFSGIIADSFIYNRALTSSEIARLADPSNVMLEMGGVPLIQHRRTWWPVAVAGTTIRWPWQQRRHRRMAGAR